MEFMVTGSWSDLGEFIFPLRIEIGKLLIRDYYN